MAYCIRILYTVDDGMEPEEWANSVHESIMTLLSTTLPYMVDNVSIHFDTEEE